MPDSTMAVEEVTTGVSEIIAVLGSLALWLQAVGVIVVAWIIFEVIALHINRKRMREVYKIKEDMRRIERKIDRVLKCVR